MKTTRQLVLTLAAALVCNTLAETNTTDTSVLKGTVLDAAGQPVEGGTVETYAQTGGLAFGVGDVEARQRVVTDAKGAFELQLPVEGVMVIARKAGLAPAWTQLARPSAEPQNLVLTPPTVLAGVVVDEADKPVAGAEVCVAVAFSEKQLDGGRRSVNYLAGKPARECFNARSGADGRFRIEGFPTNASANLSVRTPGKVLRQQPQGSLGPDSMQCHAGQEDIRLVLEPGGNIEGKVIPAETGQPLPAARLMLQPDGPGIFGLGGFEPTQANSDGTFRIADVAAGSYRLRAFFGTNTVPDWVAEPAPVSIEAGQTTRDVQISAIRGGVVEVAVLGKGDRKPLAQVGINAYRQGYQTAASSGPDGLALLRLPPGDYQLFARRPDGPGQSSSATVEAGKTNRVEIELAGPVKLQGVVHRPGGQPAVGLSVQVVGAYSPAETKAKTDASGKFEIEWNPQQYGGAERAFCLLVRDPECNLAVAQEIDEETGSLDLLLAPGLTIVGRAECAGKPITNATAALVFWAGNSGMHLQGLCTGTNQPGQFEIPALPPGRRYGLQVSAPGYGQQFISTVDSDEARRVEVDPVDLKPARLKLGGKVVDADDKPVAGAYVNLYGEGQPNANVRTDREGRFTFAQVCEGQARLSASARNAHGSIAAEGGATNVVLKLGESYSAYAGPAQRKLKGCVTDLEGKPAAGVQVAVFPFSEGRGVKTGTNGAFNLTFAIQPWQAQSGGDPCLVVRDPARNLAAAEEISEETTNLNVQLKPALTLIGRVEDPAGAPLTNAQVGVWLLACRTYSQVSEQLAPTDARGNFEVKTLPMGLQYMVFAKAKGHGRHQEQVEPESETNRLELPPFVLKVADQMVAGQVVNEDDKPVPGANVSLSGEDQPEGNATTDSKGRFSFKVCEGPVRLFAHAQRGYANATAEPGDTNVIIQLARSDPSVRESPKRASLKGKPLPDLTALGLAAADAPAGQPLLLCLFDAQQRPSRRWMRLLSEQHDALKQKGLTLLAVQATVASAGAFQTWRAANPVSFPVGRVAEPSAGTKWATSVESLPWLILTDASGRVVAEGFPLDELDAKLAALEK